MLINVNLLIKHHIYVNEVYDQFVNPLSLEALTVHSLFCRTTCKNVREFPSKFDTRASSIKVTDAKYSNF